jgi:hypothetical protein
LLQYGVLLFFVVYSLSNSAMPMIAHDNNNVICSRDCS